MSLSRPADLHKRVGEDVKLTDEELDKASLHIMTYVGEFLLYEKGPKAGRPFFEKQVLRAKNLDWMFAKLLPLKGIDLDVHEGPIPTPDEVLLNIKANFETGILATVSVQSWKTVWGKTFILAIIEAYRDSSMLKIFAVKGGAETDMEIRFIEEVMPLLGFKVVRFRDTTFGKWMDWVWEIDRPGGKLIVTLAQGATVESFPDQVLIPSFLPRQPRATAPALKNVLVMSTPLWGPDAEGEFTIQVHEKLNKRLNDAIDGMAHFMRGWTWEEIEGFAAKWESLTVGSQERDDEAAKIVNCNDAPEL